MDISELYSTFFDEAEELLAEAEQTLLAMDPASPDDGDLNSIFRAVHSVKGGAGTFGFTVLQETAHTLENVLDQARNGVLVITRERIDVFLKARDALAEYIARYRAGESIEDESRAAICDALDELVSDESRGATESSAEPAQDSPGVSSDAAESDGDRELDIRLSEVEEADQSALVDELGLLGTVNATSHEGRTLTVSMCSTEPVADIESVLCFVVRADQIEISEKPGIPESAGSESERSETNMAPDGAASSASDGRAGETGGGNRAAAGGQPDRKASETSTLRVSTTKIDDIINLVGELVITQSMLEQTAEEYDESGIRGLMERMGQLKRNTRDLQEAVMSIRMMPMDYAFNRFPRLVRDIGNNLNKEIELETVGGSTELDKGLIEQIMDPLTHLVRNSLDHGIELPDVREAAGKPRHGTITLVAQHQGGNILIEIRDDGAGLERDRILSKAREKGLSVSDYMSDEDVWQLIFAPGFSTADKVSDISGRGVGMDVVKSNIQRLGGHIRLHSEPGNGTTTQIALPLTLAVMDGMAIRVGAEVLILPVGAILESVQISAGQLKPVAGNGGVVEVRGEYLTLIELHRFFNVANAETDITQGIGIVVQSEGRSFVLFVDELIGERQVVVKNLETHFRKIEGISAATILGDGSVALILDVIGLAQTARERDKTMEHGDSSPAVEHNGAVS